MALGDSLLSAARWLSLMSTMSNRPRRWFRPPPHATAYFSNRRQPGVVLRVSRICARVPLMASTNCAVSVAMPDKPLDKIQRHALGAQDRPRRAGNFQQECRHLSPRDWPSLASRSKLMAAESSWNAASANRARDDQRFTRAHDGTGHGRFGHGGERRHVAATDVLGQGGLDSAADF